MVCAEVEHSSLLRLAWPHHADASVPDGEGASNQVLKGVVDELDGGVTHADELNGDKLRGVVVAVNTTWGDGREISIPTIPPLLRSPGDMGGDPCRRTPFNPRPPQLAVAATGDCLGGGGDPRPSQRWLISPFSLPFYFPRLPSQALKP